MTEMGKGRDTASGGHELEARAAAGTPPATIKVVTKRDTGVEGIGCRAPQAGDGLCGRSRRRGDEQHFGPKSPGSEFISLTLAYAR